MGVIPAGTYALVVFTSIGTTIVAPPLLSLAFRGGPPERHEAEGRPGSG
jgi:hypothetical protein